MHAPRTFGVCRNFASALSTSRRRHRRHRRRRRRCRLPTIFRCRDSKQTSSRRSREFFACKESQFPAPFNLAFHPPSRRLPLFPARRKPAFPIRRSVLLVFSIHELCPHSLPFFSRLFLSLFTNHLPFCSLRFRRLRSFPMILYLHLPPIVPFHLILSSCTFPSLPFLLCYFGFILLSLSSLYILFSSFPFLSLFLFFASLFKLSPLTHSNFLTFVFLLSSLSLSSITLSHRPSSFTLSGIPLLPYSTFSARLLFFYQDSPDVSLSSINLFPSRVPVRSVLFLLLISVARFFALSYPYLT